MHVQLDMYSHVMQLTPTSKDVAASVKDAMTERGVSQAALADATGIPRVTLIRRLNGHSSFTVEELANVAEHLQVPMQSFLAGAA